jgi:transposase-like protein
LWQELLPAGRHLPEDKALALAQHLAEGNGLRATGRLCGVSLNTVLRFAHRAGDHAQQFHDQMAQHVEVHQVQADEAWAFVGKKRQAL